MSELEQKNSSDVGVVVVGAIGRRPERRVWSTTGVSTDSRTVRPGELFFALKGARVDGHDFVVAALEKGAVAAVVSRDVEVPAHLRDRLIRVQDTRRALVESARAYRRQWGGLVVGVTGSNGKTTTREMVWYILSDVVPCKRSPKSYNTDVGLPLTLFLAERNDRVLIVEMGANAPGEIAELARISEPDIGIITTIAPAHLEGFLSVEGVARAKAELLDGLGPRGAAILNADNEWFDFLAARHRGTVISFGLSKRASFRGENLRREDWGHSFSVRGINFRLTVPGRHNVLNALAALAVADYLGFDLARAAQRIESFRLPEMRYQVEVVRKVTVVFDAYNANPGSMRAALETFRDTPAAGRKVAVLGDMLELGADSPDLHRSIGAEVARSGVDALWAVGKYASDVVRGAQEGGMAGQTAHAGELNAVLDEVCSFLKPGDAVLIKGSRGMQMERLVERLRGADGA